MIIDTASNAALAAYASSTASKSATDINTASATADQTSDTTQASSTVSVDLSSLSTAYSAAIASYSPYFPVRSGFSADAVVLGVSQPGAVSSSKDKTFSDVTLDARKRMDEKYALMKDSGKPYDGSDTDRNSLLGDLDRRSLYAVATNAGGQFSNEEQAAAKAVMRQQERLATGYYSGPKDQASHFTDPYANDPVGRAKAALAFLEGVSPEEKSSPEWLSQHQGLTDALAQVGTSSPASATDTGHFPNLSEILAQTDTDASPGETESTSVVFEQVQAQLQARNVTAET
jgi:hypothetical protein